MAWRLRDARDVGPSRVEALLRTAGPEWHPFVRLGVGCALARLGLAAPEDPTVQDGYGFQLGLDSGVSGSRTRSLKPHFERGRGRALWFVTGGDARACARAIEGPGHRGELWRGIGTACTFAGDPLGEAGLLPPLAGVYATDLRRGSEVAMRLWASLGRPACSRSTGGSEPGAGRVGGNQVFRPGWNVRVFVVRPKSAHSGAAAATFSRTTSLCAAAAFRGGLEALATPQWDIWSPNARSDKIALCPNCVPRAGETRRIGGQIRRTGTEEALFRARFAGLGVLSGVDR